jgi:hypothetical protein
MASVPTSAEQTNNIGAVERTAATFVQRRPLTYMVRIDAAMRPQAR